jgi:Pyruvate/2-oxoacid:ferredoxin oxidoreductase delta subunit
MQYENISISQDSSSLSGKAKTYLTIHSLGWLLLIVASAGIHTPYPTLFLITTFLFLGLGGILYSLEKFSTRLPGIANNGIWHSSFSNGGAIGWVFAILLTGFYVIYYWSSNLFGFEIFKNLYRFLDPLSHAIRGEPTQSWFFYGTLYTFAVLVTGVRAIIKYRHSRYQVIRTIVVMICQSILSWLVPALLVLFKQPEKYLNYGWPLSFKDLWPESFIGLLNHPGSLALTLAIYGIIFSFIATPILTYYYGKRWYCSWVCGCGGLANTLGDPWRQLSDKSEKAWKIEQKTIYSILGIIILITIILWISWALSIANPFTKGLVEVYGFGIGLVFSGVIGVGFYPLFGTRIWCRFGCPQAAILGIMQKVFSRFRISTNGGQCISCGNCSTYCEMGIDVRSYAEKGENIVRASCVGCGICSDVCPRGVLNLENGPKDNREAQGVDFINSFKSGIQDIEKVSAEKIWN